MFSTLLFALALFFVIAGAAVLRLVDLDNRPMHCDEAVHAIKFGQLLERGDYVYDPREYHGPSLNFLTLPVVRLASVDRLTDVTETHLRLLPAVFGIITVALVWLLRDELGYSATIWAAAITAVSPAMVFYSRYYIQEMLLVCFTLGAVVALWRFAAQARTAQETGSELFSRGQKTVLTPFLWLVLLGVCIGMMHASKETCVIALVAIIAAAALTIGELRRLCVTRLLMSGLVVVSTAAVVSALFFSSFMENPRGVIDSFTTYFHYLGRASGEGTTGQHVQSSDYYFRILFWWQRDGGPVWSEASIAALATVGLASALLGKGLRPRHVPMARFLAIYTFLMTGIYAALPYKTPWCALGLLHGMILLAGIGGAVFVRVSPTYVLKVAAISVVLAAVGHLCWQAQRASFVAYEDPKNPYVYAHSTSDVRLLADRAKKIADVHQAGSDMHIQVICPDHDHWPMPWYLREFRRVGWFGEVPRGPAAPLIITQPEMEEAVLGYVYIAQPPGQRHLMQLLQKEGDTDWQLRPHVPLRVYIRYDLWQACNSENWATSWDESSRRLQ